MVDRMRDERGLFAEINSPASPTILGSIDHAISIAGHENFGVRTTINGVEVFVTRNSEPDLVGRDLLRVINRLAEPPVSPYPSERLDDAEKLALDEAIGAGGLTGWIKKQREFL